MLSMNKKLLFVFIIKIIFTFLFIFTAPVFSEETAHYSSAAVDIREAGIHPPETGDTVSNGDGHSADRSGDLKDLLYRYINFIVLVIILVIVFRKAKILDYISLRSEEIKKKLDDLTRDKNEAERRYKEVEEKLRNFEGKRKDIIERYRQEGIHEKERIISDARARVKQILEQSEITIQNEIEAARKQLKQDIIKIASQRAQDILIKEINERDQENMVVEFVKKVGKIN